MWIHFNFLCDIHTQIKLHKAFRSKVSEWKGSLVNGSVLTYHFQLPRTPSDSLYVCLNIPSMSPPTKRNLLFSEEQITRLPREIRDTMAELSSQYFIEPRLDRLEIRDYEFNIDKPETLSSYNATVEEILNFASEGTEIALELLNDDRTKKQAWRNDKELANTISRLVNERLTTKIERHWGIHFVCNSMCLIPRIEGYLRGILSKFSDGKGYWALGYLYEIESSGNILEAVKRFVPNLTKKSLPPD